MITNQIVINRYCIDHTDEPYPHADCSLQSTPLKDIAKAQMLYRLAKHTKAEAILDLDSVWLRVTAERKPSDPGTVVVSYDSDTGCFNLDKSERMLVSAHKLYKASSGESDVLTLEPVAALEDIVLGNTYYITAEPTGAVDKLCNFELLVKCGNTTALVEAYATGIHTAV